MKRSLCAVMALLMSLCMLPNAFAEPKAYIAYEFSDFDDIDSRYLTSVITVVEMDILSGYSDDTFRPKNGLTRGAAAKIIANFREMGDYPVTSAPFRDVPLGHTFASPVAYCASQGVIGGYSDGTFRPADPLTGYAFAKMLLNTIEYTSSASRYTGSGWKDAVSQDAAASGISEQISTLNKNISREEAAEMWLSAWNYEADHWNDNDDYDDNENVLAPDSNNRSSYTYDDEPLDCPYCIGGSCPECYGTRTVDCPNCIHGECDKCFGRGEVTKQVYDKNLKMTTTTEVTCTRCNGSGDCRKCGGDMEIKCPKCNGSGDCRYCHGTGKE